MVTIHFKVSGRVQGVYFRESAKKEAERLNITGWVRNNPDNTVEGIACGTAADIEAFKLWCSTGPVMARVDHLDISPAEPINSTRFEVQH